MRSSGFSGCSGAGGGRLAVEKPAMSRGDMEVSAMSTTLDREQLQRLDGAAPTGPDPVDQELRKEAIARLKRKRRFADDAIAYLAINGVLWLIWAVTDRSTDGGLPWPAWVSAIWGFFLAADAWKAFGRWPRGLHGPITEAEVEREMERFRRA